MMNLGNSRRLWPLLCVLLAACGGGGGGGGGRSPSLSLSKSALAVTAAQAEESPVDTSVTITLRNLPDDGAFVALDFGENGIETADFFQTSDSEATLQVVFKAPSGLALGPHSDDLRVYACHDEACNRQFDGSPATVSVSYIVERTPRMTIDRTDVSVVASLGQGAPPPQTVSVTFDTVPTRGIYLSALTAGRELDGAEVIEVSPGSRSVLVSLKDPDVVGVGTNRGALILTACFDRSCTREINRGAQNVQITYRVAPNPVASTRVLTLGAQDLVFDPVSRLLYTVQSPTAPQFPNSLMATDPATGAPIGAVATGYDPRLIAVSDDGSKFYVGLPALSKVQRFSAPSFTVDFTLDLPPFAPNEGGILKQIAVAPGAAGTLAVSRNGDVFVYDDEVRRPDILGDDEFVYADTVEWSDTASVLYSSNTTVSGQPVELYQVAANASGAALQATFANAMDAGPTIHFAEGLIYSDGGRVIDAATGALRGRLIPSAQTAYTRRLAIDTNRRLAYMATKDYSDPVDALRVEVFDIDTLALIRTFEVPGAVPSATSQEVRRVVCWGDDGLAILTSGGQVILVQGPLVSDPGP